MVTEFGHATPLSKRSLRDDPDSGITQKTMKWDIINGRNAVLHGVLKEKAHWAYMTASTTLSFQLPHKNLMVLRVRATLPKVSLR